MVQKCVLNPIGKDYHPPMVLNWKAIQRNVLSNLGNKKQIMIKKQTKIKIKKNDKTLIF